MITVKCSQYFLILKVGKNNYQFKGITSFFLRDIHNSVTNNSITFINYSCLVKIATKLNKIVLKINPINNIKRKHCLKGSSLANAVFLCVIISVFCGCFVLLNHYQNLLKDRLNTQEHLISTNESAINYFLGNSWDLEYDKKEAIDIFDDGITSFIEKKHWGFYDILICKTVFKKDTVSKAMLVGGMPNVSNKLALYVTDYDKSVKLSGETEIVGDLKIPNGKYAQAYINGQKGNTIKVVGRQLKSDDKLPKIDKTIAFNIDNLQEAHIDTKEGKVFVNGFGSATRLLDVNTLDALGEVVCKGNYILYSESELHINKSLQLHDVVVIAPKVTINSGFKGNIQVVSEREVIIEEDVSLQYPSSIYIKNDIDSVLVSIKKGSKIAGGIVIDGNTHKASLHRKLSIDQDVTIIGNVYCYGSTELKGNIIGSLYTDKLFLETNSAKHENTILNSSITREALPETFIELPLFNNTLKNESYGVIKQL